MVAAAAPASELLSILCEVVRSAASPDFIDVRLCAIHLVQASGSFFNAESAAVSTVIRCFRFVQSLNVHGGFQGRLVLRDLMMVLLKCARGVFDFFNTAGILAVKAADLARLVRQHNGTIRAQHFFDVSSHFDARLSGQLLLPAYGLAQSANLVDHRTAKRLILIVTIFPGDGAKSLSADASFLRDHHVARLFVELLARLMANIHHRFFNRDEFGLVVVEVTFHLLGPVALQSHEGLFVRIVRE